MRMAPLTTVSAHRRPCASYVGRNTSHPRPASLGDENDPTRPRPQSCPPGVPGYGNFPHAPYASCRPTRSNIQPRAAPASSSCCWERAIRPTYRSARWRSTRNSTRFCPLESWRAKERTAWRTRKNGQTRPTRASVPQGSGNPHRDAGSGRSYRPAAGRT